MLCNALWVTKSPSTRSTTLTLPAGRRMIALPALFLDVGELSDTEFHPKIPILT
jgi:hypothetical protein